MTTRKLVEIYRNPESGRSTRLRYSFDRTSKTHIVAHIDHDGEGSTSVKRFASIYMAEAELNRLRKLVTELGYTERTK